MEVVKFLARDTKKYQGGIIMLTKMKNLFAEEKGQGMTEYGLVLGIIAVGAIAGLVLLRDQIGVLINNVKTNLTNNTPGVS